MLRGVAQRPDTCEVLPGQLRFLVGGCVGFPLVEVEDVLGVVHHGRFAGRITHTDSVWLHLVSAAGPTWWVECVPEQTVTVLLEP